MFVSILKRSVASTMAAGLIVAAAGFSGPATLGSGDLVNVACQKNYPSKIATFTTVRLNDSLQSYGAGNVANVKVGSSSGQPTGSVTVTVGGKSSTSKLSGGSASVSIPRLNAQRTYTVSARFKPNCNTGEFAGSSDTTNLTVNQASSSIARLSARNIKKGQRPAVSGRVSTSYSKASGTVRVQISKGRYGKSETTRVRGSKNAFRAVFSKTRSKGRWNVNVSYSGNRNYQGSSASTTFVVKGKNRR